MADSSHSAHELELIERFISSYNKIDAHLQSTLGERSSSSFRGLVDTYARRHRWWKDADFLRVCAGLRNILVHEKTKPYEYPCVPTQAVVLQLEEACESLLHPQKVIPRFKRDVVTVQVDDSLAHVLKLIHSLQFTHLPVYKYSGQQGRFVGVLTENGITRWLAEHTVREISLVDFEQEPVSEVLAREEKRRNYEFASRQTRVEELAHSFHENPYLESVLLTPHGQSDEKLLGIVTRWDVFQLS